jgi:PAS domain S-box-containing protein
LLLFSLDEIKPFGEQALVTAQAVGRLASVALQRARLFEAERHRRQEAEALREASLALSATLDADQVMEVLLDQIGRVIPYDSANVMLIEGDRVRVTHIRGYERSGTAQKVLGASLPLHETPHLRQMLVHRQLYIIPDTRADAGWVRLEFAERVRSWAGAPIVVRDEVIGFLSLDNETPNFYSAEHAESLAAFASHVAVAVENARFYQLIQDHAARLEELVRERTTELQTERDRTQAILDSAAEGVVVTDLQGHIQYVNPATERLTGYEAAELLGRNPHLWRSGRHPQSLYQKMWKTILSGQTWEGEVVNKRKDGTLYDVVLTIAPIPGPDEKPVGFVGMLTDISRLKELDRLKDQFVSNVSHELRTPLTNLKLYLNLLERGRPEKRERYMGTLQREATRLQQLIEDLLNLSRLDVGNVQLNRVPTDLNPLIRQLVEDRKLLAANRRLTLKAVLSPDLPPVLVDEKMFDQVMTNLMSNAINYTPDGGEIVIRTAETTDQGRRWVTVSVTDSGYGIALDEQERLFERFYRGEAARQTGVAGTGLGLSICQEIVKRHAGRITVQSPAPAHSPEGDIGGSQFTVWLPVA